MAFRNDLDAAHARARALEQRVAELEAENAELSAEPEPEPEPAALIVSEPAPLLQIDSSESDDFSTWLTVGVVCGILALAGLGGAMLMLGLSVLGVVLLACTALILPTAGSLLHLLEAAPPGYVLVLSGRSQEGPDGTTRGYRLLSSGRCLRAPFIEQAQHLDCRPREIKATVQGAYSKGGQPLDLELSGTIKICEQEPYIGNAVERFLGRPTAEVDRVARETVEGHLRGVLAELSAEEIRADQAAFAAEVSQACEQDLQRLGLELDELTVLSVSPSAATA